MVQCSRGVRVELCTEACVSHSTRRSALRLQYHSAATTHCAIQGELKSCTALYVIADHR